MALINDRRIINDIFNYLLAQSSDWKYSKVFISCERGDQTAFGYKSTHLRIGVSANSRVVGCVLLRFLRMIINGECPTEIFPSMNIRLGELVREIQMEESNKCLGIYEPYGELRMVLMESDEEVEIVKRIHEIELWNFDEIRTKIMSLIMNGLREEKN
jgi:hypothetical protein